MPRTNFDDFMRDLDATSDLSDDPFGIETVGGLDDEDLALLQPARPKKPATPRRPAKPKKPPIRKPK